MIITNLESLMKEGMKAENVNISDTHGNIHYIGAVYDIPSKLRRCEVLHLEYYPPTNIFVKIPYVDCSFPDIVI